MPWIIGIIIVALILFIIDREIWTYEAIHLGPRVQGWLYDRWAKKYDMDKAPMQAQDAELLAGPLLEMLAKEDVNPASVLILDVATGTGRLPVVLFQESAFAGQVISLDLSYKMLVRTAEKLSPYRERTLLIRHTATRLPFPDASFDVVSCIEALELMKDREEPLAEFFRVLKPGGVLLTSRGTDILGWIGKIISRQDFEAMLASTGFEQVQTLPFWESFDRVWARKPGRLASSITRVPLDVLVCPICRQTQMQIGADQVRCAQCGTTRKLTPQGIVLF